VGTREAGGGGDSFTSDGGHDGEFGASDQRDVAVVDAERGEDELAAEEMDEEC
jgi:hypothetical protein